MWTDAIGGGICIEGPFACAAFATNYVNGVQVSAATAASLLGMGAAAIVPIGSQTQTGSNGQIQIWQEGHDSNPNCDAGIICVGTSGHWAYVGNLGWSIRLSEWMTDPSDSVPRSAVISNVPGGKQAFCRSQSNAAALEGILPGGGSLLLGHDYRPTAVVAAAAAIAEHLDPEMAGESTALKFAIRSRTGLPMDLASKFLEAWTYLSIALMAHDGISEARKEYKACMEY